MQPVTRVRWFKGANALFKPFKLFKSFKSSPRGSSSPTGDCVVIRSEPFDKLRANGQVLEFTIATQSPDVGEETGGGFERSAAIEQFELFEL